MQNKILGCLSGAAVGDAMGAPTETKTSGQISTQFGGRVTSFQKPSSDVPARGREKAQITDAFSIPYMLTEEILKNHGQVTEEVSRRALLAWADTEYFEPFAGMTTRKVIKALKGVTKTGGWENAGHLGNKLFIGHYYALSSNGAGCKAFPAGLFSGGDVDLAVDNAIAISMGSHNDVYSISGACAVAAAISQALRENTSLPQIIDVGLYGAEQGEQLAKKRVDVRSYPGPSVLKRMEMALEIALHYASPEERIAELGARIGSGPAIAETVPAAFGILAARGGDLMESIYDGVNIGDETCAIASIAGAIAGSHQGIAPNLQRFTEEVEQKNHISLTEMACQIEKTVKNIESV